MRTTTKTVSSLALFCIVLTQLITAAKADLQKDRHLSFEEAAASAGKLDAIDIYCDAEKPAHYAEQIAIGAVRQGANPQQKASIEAKAAKAQAEALKTFRTGKTDCKAVEFMFEKYALLDQMDRQIKSLIDSWSSPSPEKPQGEL